VPRPGKCCFRAPCSGGTRCCPASTSRSVSRCSTCA
jgi:hypothetical protein